MDATAWDERYAERDLVWSAAPNQWVVETIGPLQPGQALDLAAGEGRNALWLVEQGWRVTAVDFSQVAIDRTRTLAAERLGERVSALTTLVGDATEPQAVEQDLVLLCYLHVPAEPWRRALAAAVAACTPGGHVVIIGHARQNLTDGVGGPQDPAILYDPEHVVEQLSTEPVAIERAELRHRDVPTDSGVRRARDTLVVARRL